MLNFSYGVFDHFCFVFLRFWGSISGLQIYKTKHMLDPKSVASAPIILVILSGWAFETTNYMYLEHLFGGVIFQMEQRDWAREWCSFNKNVYGRYLEKIFKEFSSQINYRNVTKRKEVGIFSFKISSGWE